MKRRPVALSLAGAIAVVVVVGVFVLRGRHAAPSPPPPIPVTAGVVQQQNVPVVIQALGTVQPVETVSVQARVSGQIAKVFFTPGHDVKAGDPLFLIDPRPYQAALEQAQGQLARDQALLAQAQSDLARYQRLAKENSIALQQAQDQAFLVQQDQGTVKLDQGNVASAQLNLDYCQVSAPAAGLAGPLLVDLGNYVQSGAGTALVTITEMQPIYVSFSIPETALADVRANQAKSPLVVEASSQAGKQIATGHVSLIDNQANTTTGTVLLQATFPNPDEALWPGAFVSVRLIVDTRQNAITVPDATVMAGPNGSYVYVIQPDDTVRRVDVTVAARQDGIDVIGKGLSAGQQVVTDGQYRLDDKAKVKIQPATAASGAPSS